MGHRGDTDFAELEKHNMKETFLRSIGDRSMEDNQSSAETNQQPWGSHVSSLTFQCRGCKAEFSSHPEFLRHAIRCTGGRTGLNR